MIHALFRRVGALAVLTIAGMGLHLAGHILDHPPLADPAAWGDTDPLLLATTVVRVAAMVACAWLATVTTVEAIALALNLHPLRHLAVVLAPAAWRSLVLRPVAIATLVLPPVAVPVVTAAPAMASTASAQDLSGDGELAPQLEMRPFHAGQTTPTLTMRYLEPEREPNGEIDQRPAPSAPVHQGSIGVDGPLRVVGPGENLWSIAASHLAEVAGSTPSSAEVTNYWRTLIEANRHVLPDPDNPDLIFRGIELTMPALG